MTVFENSSLCLISSNVLYYTVCFHSAVLYKEVSSTPTSPQKEVLIPFKRSISAPGGEDDAGKHLLEQHSFPTSEIPFVEINCVPLKAISVILDYSYPDIFMGFPFPIFF
jgi:hypothetical protein